MRPIVRGALSMPMRRFQSNLVHSRNQRIITKEAQGINKNPDPSGLCHSVPKAQGDTWLVIPSCFTSQRKQSLWWTKASQAIFCYWGSFPSSISLSFSVGWQILLLPFSFNLFSSSQQLEKNNEDFENRYFSQGRPQTSAFFTWWGLVVPGPIHGPIHKLLEEQRRN